MNDMLSGDPVANESPPQYDRILETSRGNKCTIRWNQTELTSNEWPRKVRPWLNVAISHIMAVLSALPDAMSALSNEKQAELYYMNGDAEYGLGSLWKPPLHNVGCNFRIRNLGLNQGPSPSFEYLRAYARDWQW